MNDEDLELFAARENGRNDSISTRTRGKYTEIKAHTICDHIAKGNTLRAAAAAEGISERTIHRWKNEKPHFKEMVDQAVAVSEARLVQKITQSDDWRAALAILERRFPQTWTKKDHIDMHVSRSEGLDEIKAMIKQTDHLLDVERPDVNQDK